MIPLQDINAKIDLYEQWILTHGIPYKVITDQRSQFQSVTIKKLYIFCGTILQSPNVYQPKSIKKVEQLH